VGGVVQAVARYDEFAEWYEQWIGDAPPLIAAQAGLLPAVAGQRVLDIACGQGRMSRYLARLGADVAGVDISAAMLGKARALGPGGITTFAPTLPGLPPGGTGGRSTAVPAIWR
jgi:2-polyprenyl-3-methyl-5-hydroxy-6-metoxy-1,4-benzoquinol methylase